jgi:Zn-dependent protease with chaperone function
VSGSASPATPDPVLGPPAGGTGQADASFPYLGAELETPGALPARGTWRAWAAALTAGYALLAVLAVLIVQAGSRPGAVVMLVAYPLLGIAAIRIGLRRRVRRRLGHPDVEPVQAPAVTAALTATGIRTVTVACFSVADRVSGRSAGRAFRYGRCGAILLRAELRRARRDLARFITVHEAAHIARRDSVTGALAVVYPVSLALAAVLTGAMALVLLIPAVIGLVGYNWLRELACDRAAVAVTGRAGAEQYIAYLGRLGAARAPWIRRIQGALTHPPGGLRTRAITRDARRLAESGR